MRKTLLYFVILLLLITGIYFFFFNNNTNPYSATEAGFTITDTAAIGKLFLAANNGESILAERTDTGWIVNKRYKALSSTLNLILMTLNKETALYPVTTNAYNNVIRQMSTNAIKLEIYGRDGKKTKTIYVGGAAVNNMGTNMLLEGAKSPYVVQVPGFNGYLSSRFTTNIKDWRDRTVFSMPAQEIKRVSVQYPGDKAINSFTISRENGSLTVTGDSNITHSLDAPNQNRANIYLGYFSRVSCEGYLNGLNDLDTSIKTAPLHSRIDLEGMHGQRQHADIYWLAINRRSKNLTVSDPNIPDGFDADRLYAVINDGRDTVLVQQYAFARLFRKCFEFFQKDVQPPPMAKPNELPSGLLQK